jgi:hypothetical protein
MTNLKTIYDQYKDNWDLLAAIGKPNVAEAAKNFYTFADMERAIGYTASTVKKWAEGHNNVSSRSEGMAAHWLAAQGKDGKVKHGPHRMWKVTRMLIGHHATGICRQSSPRAGNDGLRV